MKRDWDIIREILIRLEETSSLADNLTPKSFPSNRASEISYHMALLIEAGLVDGKILKTNNSSGSFPFSAYRLTWKGHELLDAIRSDTVWQKTKKSFVSNGLSMTHDLIKSVACDVAASLIKQTIGC